MNWDTYFRQYANQGLISEWYAATFDQTAHVQLSASEKGKHGLFDLASLTKPVVTGLMCLALCQQRKLDVAMAVADAIPEVSVAGGRLQLWHLLSHTAGLRAFDHSKLATSLGQHCRSSLGSTAERLQWVRNNVQDWIVDSPGAGYLYSDMGYVIAGVLIEMVTGVPLNRAFGRWLKQNIPCIEGLGFIDADFCDGLKNDLISNVEPRYEASTGQFLPPAAVPHDPLAQYLGGAAGHAGLFGSGNALIEFVRAVWSQSEKWLGEVGRELYLDTIPWAAGLRCTLGWDKPGDNSAAGVGYEEDTIGHLGFSGVSIWYSPKYKYGSVLLTNAGRHLPTLALDSLGGYSVPAAWRQGVLAMRQGFHGSCWRN